MVIILKELFSKFINIFLQAMRFFYFFIFVITLKVEFILI